MAAWTDTSSALVGSSATTISRVAGERAGDRDALLEPARQLARLEVEVALGQAQVGGQLVDPLVDRLALEPGQLAHRAGQDAARGPAAVERRVGVLEDHLDGALVRGRPAGAMCAASACSSSSRLPPASGLSMPRIVLARVDLPEPDSPTSPSVSPSNSSRSTLTRAGTSWPLWWKVFDTCSTAQGHGRRGPCRRRRSAAARRSRPSRSRWWQRVQRPPPTSTIGGTTVRHSSSASGQRSTKTQVGRSVPICGRLPGIVDSARSDLRTPRRGSERSRPRVYGCSGSLEDGRRRRPPRRSCRRTSRRPGRTASG